MGRKTTPKRKRDGRKKETCINISANDKKKRSQGMIKHGKESNNMWLLRSRRNI